MGGVLLKLINNDTIKPNNNDKQFDNKVYNDTCHHSQQESASKSLIYEEYDKNCVWFKFLVPHVFWHICISLHTTLVTRQQHCDRSQPVNSWYREYDSFTCSVWI